MLRAFECNYTLLMVVKMAAVAADDQEQLHSILVRIGRGVRIRSMDFSFQFGQTLPNDQGVCPLLVLFELCILLLCLSNISLPDVALSWCKHLCSSRWHGVDGDINLGELQFPDGFCHLRSSLVLLLDVVCYSINQFLVLCSKLDTSQSKVWLS